MLSCIARRNSSWKNLRHYQFLFATRNNSSSSAANSVKGFLAFPTRHQYFATAAHQYVSNGELKSEQNKGITSENVTRTLAEIDNIIQRTGRIARRHVDTVFSMIKDSGSASDINGLYLLRCCNLVLSDPPSERVVLANQIWKQLKDMGCHLNINHFNALLNVYVKNNYSFSPSTFLNTIENHGEKANKMTYYLLMQKFCDDGNLNGASEILQFLKEKGLSIDEAMFNNLIKGHMRSNDSSGARSILEVMRSSNLAPNAESYVNLVCGYIENDNIEEAKVALKEAKENVNLSNKDMLAIIECLALSRNSEVIDELLGMMPNIQGSKQEMLNTLTSLIHKGAHESAFKLFLLLPDVASIDCLLFIRQLVKVEKVEVEDVMKYCEKIQGMNITENMYAFAAKTAIECENFDLTIKLFDALQAKGFRLRMYHFRPVLSHFKNQRDEEGILRTLKKISENGIVLDFSIFIKDILPAIKVDNPQDVLRRIEEAGHTVSAVIDPLFEFYCVNGSFDNALFLTKSYDLSIHPDFDLERFLRLWSEKFKSSSSYINLVAFLMKHSRGVSFTRYKEVSVGQNIALLLEIDPRVFEALPANDSEIFNERTLSVCRKILKERNHDLLFYLKKFSSVPSLNTQVPVNLTIEEEEEKLASLKNKGSSTHQYLMGLIEHHIRKKDISRVNELRDRLFSTVEDDLIGPLIYCKLFAFYCEIAELQVADKFLIDIKEKFPTFKIDAIRLLNYATLLIKLSKFDEARTFVQENFKEMNTFGYTEEGVAKGIKKLFNAAVDSGNSELVESIQNLLLEHAKKFPSQQDVFYEPSIKSHLFRNNLDDALREFENCVVNHKVAPCLGLLLKKCIVHDHEKFENVIELASSAIGRNNVLHELVSAFLETGRRNKALQILEKLGSKVNALQLESMCHRFYNLNRVSELEDLFLISSGIQHVDREMICYHLFKLYDQKNDCSKALDVFNTIEREKLFQLSDKTKMLLQNLLSRSNADIELGDTSNEQALQFSKLVVKGSTLEALELINNMKKGLIRSIPLSDITAFFDLLLKEKCIHAITDNVQAMSYAIENVTAVGKPLLEKYTESSDIESLIGLTNIFPDFALKKISFNSYLNEAYLKSGKHEELLQLLEDRYANKNKNFSFGAFQQLLKIPELENRVINLAKKYVEMDFGVPIAIVWAHFLTSGNYEKADDIYKSYSIVADKVDFMVLRAVTEKEDIFMAKKYISSIKMDIRSRTKEKAYGTLLNIYVSKEMLDDATSLVKEAKEKNVYLEKYFKSSLLALKNALEKNNKNVPFSISSEPEGITSA